MHSKSKHAYQLTTVIPTLPVGQKDFVEIYVRVQIASNDLRRNDQSHIRTLMDTNNKSEPLNGRLG